MSKQLITVKLFNLIERAVEEGARYGYTRAHKHTDEPEEETIITEITTHIMNELSEIIEWD